MSDIEQVFINPDEERKPIKKKRVLSDKQKEALARGREKRAAKLREKLNKKAEKDMVKEHKQQLKNSYYRTQGKQQVYRT